jgi:CheY-like chemotaxis protein
MARVYAVEPWLRSWAGGDFEALDVASDVGDIDHLCDSLVKDLKKKATEIDGLLVVCADWKPFQTSRRYEQNGVRLLKHLRLTPELGDLRLMHAIILSFEPVEELIRRRPESSLLLSRGVTFLRLPDGVEMLQNPDFVARRFAIRADRAGLKIAASVRSDFRDDPLDPHSFRNRFGALKLCKEFAGDLLGVEHEFLLKQEREASASLEMKRLREAQPDLIVGAPPETSQWQKFRESCGRHKVLLIDDEHATGWSLALLAGLSGRTVTPEEYRSFLTGPQASTTRNLLAVADLNEAELVFDRLKSALEEALQQWKSASDAADQAELEFSDAVHKEQNANRAAQGADGVVEEAGISFQRAESALWDARRAAQQLLEPFFQVAEECVTLPGTEIDRVFETLDRSRQTLSDLGRALDNVAAASARLRDARKQFQEASRAAEAAKTTLGESRQLLSASTRDQQEAKHRLGAALGRLSSALSFDLVLLDLRLDPAADASRSISETSGIRLLRKIRETVPPMPVLMLTASEKAVSYTECISCGASGYWIKGVSTGQDMRALLLKAFEQSELLPLWLKLEQVRVKTTVAAKTWEGSAFVPRAIPSTALERRAIDVLLEDSYRRLWDGSGSDRAPYSTVIVNLGGIQEIRYQGIKDPNNQTYWYRTPKDDQDLRKLRNDVAHPRTTTSVSRADACKYLSYTLDQLLA